MTPRPFLLTNTVRTRLHQAGLHMEMTLREYLEDTEDFVSEEYLAAMRFEFEELLLERAGEFEPEPQSEWLAEQDLSERAELERDQAA